MKNKMWKLYKYISKIVVISIDDFQFQENLWLNVKNDDKVKAKVAGFI